MVWWARSSRSGHPSAQFYLATCYDFGRGTVRNVRRAMSLYRSAAIQGNEAAQYNLDLGYRDGEGLPQDAQCSVYWLKRAAAQNDPDALRDLGVLAFGITPVIARWSSLRGRAARERALGDGIAVGIAFARRVGSCGSRIRAS